MVEDITPGYLRVQRPVIFILFLAGGLMVFLLGNNYNQYFWTNTSSAYKGGLVLAFLALALWLRQNHRWSRHWPIAYALFIAAFANALMALMGNWLDPFLYLPSGSAIKLAIDKLEQFIPVVLSIVLFTRLMGDDLGSIFLKKGDLAWSLRFGLASFGIFTLLFLTYALLQANAPPNSGLFATGLPSNRVFAAIPSMLIWAFANSLMEELWFRGIFLGKLTPHLGVVAAIIVTALVFGISHAGATYITSAERILFSSIAFGLALINGYVMLKTGSIWGSVLFHAGYDLIILIPVLVSVL